MTKHCVLAGFTLAAAVALGPLCSATDHPAGPSQDTEMFGGVPQIAASQSLDEVAWHPAPDRVARAIARRQRKEPAAAC
jgi:hypothetical protein